MARRTLHGLGDPLTGRPRDLEMLSSPHFGSKCRKSFNADTTDLAHPGSHPTRRVVDTDVRLAVEDGLPDRTVGWALWCDHRVFVPDATIQYRVEAGGRKAAPHRRTAHLDGAHAGFPGSIAADRLYDGPIGILSMVDDRTSKRLACHVRSHAPTSGHVEAIFRRFPAAREARGLTVRGITTDGSAWSPEPIAAVLGDVPHGVCTFHVRREVTQAVRSGVAQEKTVDGVRTRRAIEGRPALDLRRGRQGDGRPETAQTRHKARAA